MDSPAGGSNARRELQGPRPPHLTINQDSGIFKKPPPPSGQKSKPIRRPVVIYSVSPKTIHTTPEHFKDLVQRLTGMRSSSSTNASDDDHHQVRTPTVVQKGFNHSMEKEIQQISSYVAEGIPDFPMGLLPPEPVLPQIPSNLLAPSFCSTHPLWSIISTQEGSLVPNIDDFYPSGDQNQVTGEVTAVSQAAHYAIVENATNSLEKNRRKRMRVMEGMKTSNINHEGSDHRIPNFPTAILTPAETLPPAIRSDIFTPPDDPIPIVSPLGSWNSTEEGNVMLSFDASSCSSGDHFPVTGAANPLSPTFEHATQEMQVTSDHGGAQWTPDFPAGVLNSPAGILSPVPTSLPEIPSNLFTPPADSRPLSSFFQDPVPRIPPPDRSNSTEGDNTTPIPNFYYPPIPYPPDSSVDDLLNDFTDDMINELL